MSIFKRQWFFIIRNTLKDFLSKPLELLVCISFWQINWKPYIKIIWIKKITRTCYFIQKVSRSKVSFILLKGVLHYLASHHFVYLRFPCRSPLLITLPNPYSFCNKVPDIQCGFFHFLIFAFKNVVSFITYPFTPQVVYSFNIYFPVIMTNFNR